MLNIDDLIKESMKSRNQTELRAYKNLKAEIQTFKTAKNAKPYNEAAEIQLISKMCKKLEDGILGFSEAGREDLMSEYRDELAVLKKLLPEPVNESQIHSELCIWAGKNKFIKTFLTEDWGYRYDAIETSKPFIPKKEMGNAIKHLKSKFPQADGKLISTIVKSVTV